MSRFPTRCQLLLVLLLLPMLPAHADMIDRLLRSGPEFVDQVTFEGLEAVPVELARSLVLTRPRDDFDAEAVERDLDRLRSSGWFAEAAADVDRDDLGVRVHFMLREHEPLPSTRIRRIAISGNEHTRRPVILREVRLTAGDELTWTKLEGSLRELRELRIFAKVGFHLEAVKPAGEGLQSAVLVIDIEEGFTEAGILVPTFSTDNPDLGGLGPAGGYINKNLLGTGMQLFAGGIWAETRAVGGGLAVPHALGTDGYLTLVGGYGDQEEDIYDRKARPTGRQYRAEVWVGAAYWRQPLDAEEEWEAALGLGYVDAEVHGIDGPPPASSGRGPLLIAGVGVDRRDDPDEPVDGYRARVRLDAGHKRSAEERNRAIARGNLEYQHFVPFGERHTLALMAKGGLANKDVPFLAKYTLGGQSSMRGYPSGSLRGDTYVWGVGEYRFPIVNVRHDRALTGAVFAEVGDAWDRGSDDAPFQWRRSGGAGVRVVLGAFIFRVDVAASPADEGAYVFIGHYF